MRCELDGINERDRFKKSSRRKKNRKFSNNLNREESRTKANGKGIKCKHKESRKGTQNKENKKKEKQISGVRDKKANKTEERIEKDVTLLNERREGKKLVPIVVKSCYILATYTKENTKKANKKQYTVNAYE